MIVVLQRVRCAAVRVEGRIVGAIEGGVCLLCCALSGDEADEVDWLADKIAGLRIFEDDGGKVNRALGEVGGAVLVVPQFTLAADWRKGRRPSFARAARPERAEELLGVFAARLAAAGLTVEGGVFGARMAVELVNDGPFTLVLDSAQRPR